MDILAGVTVLMLVVGWVYMAGKFPVRLPQQTVASRRTGFGGPASWRKSKGLGATFDNNRHTGDQRRSD